MDTLKYHLSELEIAKDHENSSRVMPVILPTDKVIMDLGCGIGQTFIALECTDRTCVGIDIDEEVIEYGRKHFGDKIDFYLADAANIPYPSGSVDFLISRVAIPYTNIPIVIKEIKRLLTDEGRIWITLHSKKMVWGWLKRSIRSLSFKDIIHKSYVLLNGYLFKYFGIVIPFIKGGYESWQDKDAMIKALGENGISATVKEADGHTIINGKVKIISN